MKWIKASERLPEKRHNYFVHRHQFDDTNNPTYNSTAEFQPATNCFYKSEYGELRKVQVESWPDESEQPIPQDIDKWIEDEAEKYSRAGNLRFAFIAGAQLLLPELQRLRDGNEEIKRRRKREQDWFDREIEQQKSQIEELKSKLENAGKIYDDIHGNLKQQAAEIESLKKEIERLKKQVEYYKFEH